MLDIDEHRRLFAQAGFPDISSCDATGSRMDLRNRQKTLTPTAVANESLRTLHFTLNVETSRLDSLTQSSTLNKLRF